MFYLQLPVWLTDYEFWINMLAYSHAMINPIIYITFNENFKKSFTMQRAKDLAENARVTMAKDKEIVQLKEKVASLEEQLKNNLAVATVKLIYHS